MSIYICNQSLTSIQKSSANSRNQTLCIKHAKQNIRKNGVELSMSVARRRTKVINRGWSTFPCSYGMSIVAPSSHRWVKCYAKTSNPIESQSEGVDHVNSQETNWKILLKKSETSKYLRLVPIITDFIIQSVLIIIQCPRETLLFSSKVCVSLADYMRHRV